MPHPNEILVRQAYLAQSRGDIEGYIGLLSDDFVLHIPGRSQIAGDYRGKDDVRRHFREIADLSGGTLRMEVHDVLASEEHVVALVNARAEREGVFVDLQRVHVWHVREGKLGELWLHPADQYAFDGYWASRA
jgi:ketosteroid isomerase-like protein